MTYEVIVGLVCKNLEAQNNKYIDYLEPLGKFPVELEHFKEHIRFFEVSNMTWLSGRADGESDWLFSADLPMAEAILRQISSLIESADEAIFVISDQGSYQVNPIICFPRKEIKQRLIEWLRGGVPVGSTIFILR